MLNKQRKLSLKQKKKMTLSSLRDSSSFLKNSG